MKRHKSIRSMMCGVVCAALASTFTVNQATADGTEELGLPSIPIANGSYIVVEGTGLHEAQPGQIEIAIPSDTDIAQVLLYWGGRTLRPSTYPNGELSHGDSDTIMVNGEVLTGIHIGGPTLNPYSCDAYRVDITSISSNLGWIQVGQTNILAVDGLDFSHHNAGASLVVILDDGTASNIQILDDCDYAYKTHNLETVPVDLAFEASNVDRIGYLQLIVTDIDTPRPAAVDVTVDGVTTRVTEDLLENEGDFLDIVQLEVSVPAGVTNLTVQMLSIDDDTGQDPASLAWICTTWDIAEPNVSQGCTYTIGYWKNHPYDWPTDELSLWSMHDAMLTLWEKPKGGNAYIILAHQYIAAELNVVNGASIPEEVLEAWLDAQELLEAYAGKGTIPKKSDDRDAAIALASMLDDYNNGVIGPGHCD